ncbi:MAG: hypothetical protein ACP5XB_18880 [Isosphaeraceae bacterium]
MCGHRWLGALGLSVLILTGGAGCQTSGSRRSTPEPGLTMTPDSNGTVAEAPQAKTVSYVDRHPLLSKPREYWENAGDNKIVKAGAATFIGVPAGIFGELKQIVVGTPPQTR